MVKEDEQVRAMREMVRSLANEKIAPRAAQIDEDEEFPQDIVQLYRENGLLSVLVPEEFGGAGGNVMHEAAIAEELGRVDVSSAITFTGQSLCTEVINYMASPEQRQMFLPRIADGALLAIALSEPGAGSDAAAIRTTATRAEGGYALSGTKHYCTNGDVADLIVVFAVTAPGKKARGISVFLVERANPGLKIIRREKKMGLHGTTTVEMAFDDCFVPESARLGAEHEGFSAAMHSLERGRVAVGAVAVGVAQGALDYAAAHARERHQFGKPIGAFQGLQFMLADMSIQTEAARRLVYYSAELAHENDPKYQAISAKAKCFATDVAMKVTTDAVQILGGLGYMRGCPVERMMRDAKILQIFEGTNQLMRVLVARDVVGRL